MFNRHGLSGRGATRAAGDVVGTAFVTVLLLKLALFVALAALVVLLIVLTYRLATRNRRPVVAPVARPARIDDAAARAHRARMARILAGH